MGQLIDHIESKKKIKTLFWRFTGKIDILFVKRKD